MKVRVGVIKILRHGRVGTGFHLGDEMLQVLLRAPRLRVVLGISGDLDMKMIARLLANEPDQIGRVAKLAGHRHARWQIATQGNGVPDALVPVAMNDIANIRARRAYAGNVRRCCMPGCTNIQHRRERTLLRGAACAKRHREKRRIELRKLLHRVTQLCGTFGGLGREKFETEFA